MELLRVPAAEGRGERLLAVLGPSGSGKSSVVRAGLVPALRRGVLEGSAAWPVAMVKPGAHPLESLAVALDTLGRDSGRPIYEHLKGQADGSRSLHTAARLILGEPPRAGRLVVVVDQFEEVFTLCASADLQATFVENLLHAVAEPGGPVIVVLAMRADFYGHCANYRPLAGLMPRRQELVGPMAADELRWAIEKPAQRCGGSAEPGLVEVLLRDCLGTDYGRRAGESSVATAGGGAEVPSNPGHLPLLEFALSELWKRRVGGRMTAEAYREIGGLFGALERHADEEYRKVVEDEPSATPTIRRVFLTLVHPGQGAEDTRRTVPLASLASDPKIEAVVQRMVDARLLTTDDATRVQPSVDLAHEALIRHWTKLRKWIAEARGELLTRDRLEDDSREWAMVRDRHPDYLYGGARLQVALEWAANHPEESAGLDHVAEFLKASQKEVERRRYEELSRERSWRKWLSAGLVAAMIAATAAGLGWNRAAEYARKAREKAAEATLQAKVALSRQLAAAAESQRSIKPDRAAVLAAEALHRHPTYETYTVLTRIFPLHRSGVIRFVHHAEPDPSFVAVSYAKDAKDGLKIAAAVGSSVELFDAATGPRRGERAGLPGNVWSLAFDPDGRTLAAGYGGPGGRGGVALLDAATGAPRGEPAGLPGGVGRLVYNPDGRILKIGYFFKNRQSANVASLTTHDQAWLERAGRFANRNLTLAEWREYVPGHPYRPTFLEVPVPPFDARYGDIAQNMSRAEWQRRFGEVAYRETFPGRPVPADQPDDSEEVILPARR